MKWNTHLKKIDGICVGSFNQVCNALPKIQNMFISMKGSDKIVTFGFNVKGKKLPII
jgi:hypothetical protein